MKINSWKNRPPKRGKKDDYIKRLKEQRDEFKNGLEFALTLIPADKLPNGVSLDSLRWLVGQGRNLKNE